MADKDKENNMTDDMSLLTEREAKLVEALEFYASEDNYKIKREIFSGKMKIWSEVRVDRGHIAKIALNIIKL